MLARQLGQFPEVTPDRIADSPDGLILEPEDRAPEVVEATSGRSLFILGPPGNGKTSLGRMLHEARGIRVEQRRRGWTLSVPRIRPGRGGHEGLLDPGLVALGQRPDRAAVVGLRDVADQERPGLAIG